MEDLRDFVNTPAVSGYERHLSKQIAARLKPFSPQIDNLGDVVLTLGSGSPHRLIVAPLDEPGSSSAKSRLTATSASKASRKTDARLSSPISTPPNPSAFKPCREVGSTASSQACPFICNISAHQLPNRASSKTCTSISARTPRGSPPAPALISSARSPSIAPSPT